MIRQKLNPVLIPDNKSGAYAVIEKPNGLNYIDIDTVDAAEKVDFGNATTNPAYNFLGSGLLTPNGGVSIPANQDIILSSTSDVIGTTYSIAGATGNIVSNGSLTLGGTTSIVGFLDDDTMSANSNVHGVTQQSLVAYVATELASTVITDHGGLTGLGDDDHTQYSLVNGSRDFTGKVKVVYDGGSGATPSGIANTFVVDNSTYGGMSLLGGDAYSNFLTFGTTSDFQGATLSWTYATGLFNISTSKVGGYIRFVTDTSSVALTLGADQSATFTGMIYANGGVTLSANDDISLSSTSDVVGTTYSIAGATGNIISSGSLTLGGTTSIVGFLDDDTMAANSNVHGVTQQSLVAYVGTELASTVITDHGGLTGLSDDDHTQYALVNGTRDFTGKVKIVYGGGSGATAYVAANTFVVDSSTYGGMSLLGSDGVSQNLAFGTTSDYLGAYMSWYYPSEKLSISTHTTNGYIAFATGVASIALTLAANRDATFYGAIYATEGVTVSANRDVILSSTSDVLGTTYSIAGATGNIISSGSLTLGGTTSIVGFLDDDTMSANSAVHGVTQQSLVAYVGSELASTVITDHGGLTGLGDDDHTQYSLVNGNRDFTGKVKIVLGGGSGATPSGIANNFVVNSSTYGGMSLLGGDGNSQYLIFGTTSDFQGATMSWSYGTGLFNISTSKVGGYIRFVTNTSSVALTLGADQSATFTGMIYANGGVTLGSNDDVILSTTSELTLNQVTANRVLFTDGSKNVIGVNTTGSGNVVMSASPTLTGNLVANTASFIGDVVFGSNKAKIFATTGNMTLAGTFTPAGSIIANGGISVGTGVHLTTSATSNLIVGNALTVIGSSNITTVNGNFLLGDEAGWVSGAQASLGTGQTTSSGADSNRDNVGGNSFIEVSPSGSNYYYGLTGLVNKRYYTIINKGSQTAQILNPSGTVTKAYVLIGYARTFFHDGGVMYFDGTS